MNPGIFFLIISGLWSSVTVSFYLWEKYDWNNGVSRISGKLWRHFDTASDGSRGYEDGEGNYLWVSYGVDKRRD